MVGKKDLLLEKADRLAHEIYRVSRDFPKDERYGLTSQLRRSIVSVPFNMVEGYARFKKKSHIQFLEIAFWSLREAHYIWKFCYEEKLIVEVDFMRLDRLFIEVEKMLYAKMNTLRDSLD